MNDPIKITATIGAYLSSSRGMPDDVLRYSGDADLHPEMLGSLLTYSASDMSGIWTRVGDAQITVTLMPRDEQVAAAVKGLEAKLAEAREQFQKVQREILGRIQNLQALTNEVEA